nr:hypothetical protein [uncultured Prevotella sp.]
MKEIEIALHNFLPQKYSVVVCASRKVKLPAFLMLRSPNEHVKRAHLKADLAQLASSFSPDGEPVLALFHLLAVTETKKGNTCVLPLPVQRYDMKSQNANQWRKYFPKMRLVVFARQRLFSFVPLWRRLPKDRHANAHFLPIRSCTLLGVAKIIK